MLPRPRAKQSEAERLQEELVDLIKKGWTLRPEQDLQGLLDQGARYQNVQDDTLMHLAAREVSINILPILIAKFPELLDQPNGIGELPILHAASGHEVMRVDQILEARPEMIHTPGLIFRALINRDTMMVMHLVSKGADPCSVDAEGHKASELIPRNQKGEAFNPSQQKLLDYLTISESRAA